MHSRLAGAVEIIGINKRAVATLNAVSIVFGGGFPCVSNTLHWSSTRFPHAESLAGQGSGEDGPVGRISAGLEQEVLRRLRRG